MSEARKDFFARISGAAIGIFFGLTFVGGCTGSTAGGIKIFRFQVLFEIGRAQMPKTAISEVNTDSSIAAALEAAPRFDHVLVHGDPAVFSFDESFPHAPAIAAMAIVAV